MPMIEPDWEFFDWALQQISDGVWSQPQIIAFEYGGVGGLFGALMQPDTLAAQVPRLRAMIDSVATNPC